MKKIALFAMGAAVALSLAACGDEESNEPQTHKDSKKEEGQLCSGDDDCATGLICTKNAVNKNVCMEKNFTISDFCYWTFAGEGAVKDAENVIVCAPENARDYVDSVVTCHGSGNSQEICGSTGSCGQLADSTFECICNPGYTFVKLDTGTACYDVAENFCEDDSNTEVSACIESNNGYKDYMVAVVCENKEVANSEVCDNCSMVDGVATCE